MKTAEYRDIIRVITVRAFRNRFPGLKSKELNEIAVIIARNIHARMYGANVEGVPSPLWRMEDEQEPVIPAAQLLKEAI